MLFGGVIIKIGVDDDGMDVAGDKQGGILQIFAVQLELAVRLVQILMRPLVFPNEMIFEKYVGEPFTAVWLNGARFKRKGLACRVMFDGVWMADESAHIIKVGLGNGRFLLLYLVPFSNKFLWSHTTIINCQLLIVNYQLSITIPSTIMARYGKTRYNKIQQTEQFHGINHDISTALSAI